MKGLLMPRHRPWLKCFPCLLGKLHLLDGLCVLPDLIEVLHEAVLELHIWRRSSHEMVLKVFRIYCGKAGEKA